MNYAWGSHYYQKMDWLHFGQNWTRDQGAGYDKKFESTSNQCYYATNVEVSYDHPRF